MPHAGLSQAGASAQMGSLEGVLPQAEGDSPSQGLVLNTEASGSVVVGTIPAFPKEGGLSGGAGLGPGDGSEGQDLGQRERVPCRLCGRYQVRLFGDTSGCRRRRVWVTLRTVTQSPGAQRSTLLTEHQSPDTRGSLLHRRPSGPAPMGVQQPLPYTKLSPAREPERHFPTGCWQTV